MPQLKTTFNGSLTSIEVIKFIKCLKFKGTIVKNLRGNGNIRSLSQTVETLTSARTGDQNSGERNFIYVAFYFLNAWKRLE